MYMGWPWWLVIHVHERITLEFSASCKRHTAYEEGYGPVGGGLQEGYGGATGLRPRSPCPNP